MKATFERSSVHALAVLAVTHWGALFSEEKEAWISAAAERTVTKGFFRKRTFKIGRALAEHAWGGSSWTWYADALQGGDGGRYSYYLRNLAVAQRIVDLAANADAQTVILDDEELRALEPVSAVSQ